MAMSKTFSFPFGRTNRRGFLRAGIVGGAGLAVAQFVGPGKLKADTIWGAHVAASSDDAYQPMVGIPNLTSSSIPLPQDTTRCGFRFLDVTVPNGATITEAYFSIYLYDDAQEATVPVYLQAADTALTFTTQKWNLSRTTTVNYGTIGGLQAGGTWMQSTDISAAVKEVVDRPGWESGNAMAVITWSGAYYNGILNATAYDATDNPLYASYLEIHYTT
jgi:hypothetical protein